VKTTKPTGNITIPEHVAQALKIEDLINVKAGTLDLDENDLNDIIDSDNDESNNDNKSTLPPKKVHYIAHHSKAPRLSLSQIRNGNHTFLTNISLALDPSSCQARQDNFQLQFMQS
jgi:hypothetical protein